MTKVKRICAVLLCITTLMSVFCSMAFTVSAATRGSTRTTTITVKTKANYWYPGASSITLKQEKQTLTYRQLFGSRTKTKTGYYGCYNITVYNITENTYDYEYWSGGRTKKIQLDPNCTYRITLSYNANNTALFTSQPWGYSWKKTSNPSWKVNSTWKVSSYS